MNRSPTRLMLGHGEEYLLVPSSDVQRWNRAAAYEFMIEALTDGLGSAELRRLAEQLGHARDDASVESLAGWLADAIAEGRLVPVELPTPPVGMRPLVRATDRTDRGTTVVPRPVPPTQGDVAAGWIAIELLRRDGRALGGAEATLVFADGRRDRVVCDDAGHHTTKGLERGVRIDVALPAWQALPAAGDAASAVPQGLVVEVRAMAGSRVPLGGIERHYRIFVEAPPPGFSG